MYTKDFTTNGSAINPSKGILSSYKKWLEFGHVIMY